MAARNADGFYRATRRILPRGYAARLALCAGLAALAPTAALVAIVALSGAPQPIAVTLLIAGVVGAALGVAGVRALAAPVERIALSLRPLSDTPGEAQGDAVARIARGVEALSRRLDAATRRVDPTRLDDPLTGLPNRLAAMRRGRDEITRARRGGVSLSVAVIAFRDPPAVDDKAARPRLEAALRLSAELLVQTLRAYDVVGRWDGARFIAILPEAEVEHAVSAVRRAAEQQQEAVAPHGFDDRWSLCAGVAVLQPDDATLADMAARAEKALDRALCGFGGGVEAAPGPRSRPAHLTSV